MFDLKARYVPALSGAAESTGYKAKCKYTGKPMTFWEDTSYFKYPYLLMSAWYGLKVGPGGEWRTEQRMKKGDVFVLGDSGGFQAVTQGAKLDDEKFNAKKVILWQNENVDAGLILDVPPFKAMERQTKALQSKDQLTVDNRTKAQIAAFGVEFDFAGCLKKTVDNAAVMNKYKANQWLYGVVQGTTDEKMMKWYEAVKEEGDFDGWALAPKPNDDYGLIYRMMKLAYEHDLGPLHFLQLGGPMATVMIERFSKIYDYPITYDNSTAFKMGGVFRIYQTTDSHGTTDGGKNIAVGHQSLHPSKYKLLGADTEDHRYERESIDFSRRKNDPIARESWKWIDTYVKNGKVTYPCGCGICEVIEFKDLQEPGVEGALYLILHDLYAYTAEQKRSKAMALSDDLVRKNIIRSKQPTSYKGENVIQLLNNIDNKFQEKSSGIDAFF